MYGSNLQLYQRTCDMNSLAYLYFFSPEIVYRKLLFVRSLIGPISLQNNGGRAIFSEVQLTGKTAKRRNILLIHGHFEA